MTEKKKLKFEDIAVIMLETIYQTIIPVLGFWMFMKLKLIWSLLLMIFPLFIKVKFAETEKEKIYTRNARFK
jgi:hypothetical protein